MVDHHLVARLVAHERTLWEEISRGIPSWHPRAEANDETGGDEGGDAGDTAATATKDDEAVEKAYAKLRDAEKRAGKLAAQVKRFERSNMEESERLKAEQADKDKMIEDLTARLDRKELMEKVGDIARSMKFKKPSVAAKFVTAGVTDEAGIRAALKDAIDDIPELVSDGSPPPPINEQLGPQRDQASENARMNSAIRRAAGRTG